MRKTKRLTALLLAVITICGLIPFSMFSLSAAADWEQADRQSIVDAVGANNVMVDAVFGNNKNTQTATNDINADTYGSTGTQITFNTSKSYLTVIERGSGDYAWQYGPAAAADTTNNQAYINVQAYNGSAGGSSNITGSRNAGWTKKSFVASMDIRGGDYYFATQSFVQIGSRVAPDDGDGPNNAAILGIDANGNVYCNLDANKKTLVTLTKDEYVNLAVYCDRTDLLNSKFYIYVNGVCVTPDGFAWGTHANGSGKPWAADKEYSWGKVEAGEWFVGGMRLYHIGDPADGHVVGKTGIAFDNLKFYFTDEDTGFVGERKVVGAYNGVLYDENSNPITADGVHTVGGKTYLVEGGKLVQRTSVDLLSLASGASKFVEHFKYTALEDSAYIMSNGFEGWTVQFPSLDFTKHQYVAVDCYIPAEYKDAEFQINIGQNERRYKVEFIGATSESEYAKATEAEAHAAVMAASNELKSTIAQANWVLVDADKNGVADYTGGSVNNNNYKDVTLKTADGTISVFGRLGDYDSGASYGLRTYSYGQYGEYRMYNMESGWHTLLMPTSNIPGAINTQVEFISMTTTGWSLNTDRTWNTEKYPAGWKAEKPTQVGNPDYAYPDKAKCDIKFKNLRFVDELVIAGSGATPSGWTGTPGAVGSKYAYLGSAEYATGYAVIEGKWYQFTPAGKCLGLLNGMYTMELPGIVGKTNTKVNRYFIDGEMQFGSFETPNGTLNADEKTGALDDASSHVACKAHIPSSTTYVIGGDNELFFNNHHYYTCMFCGIKMNPVEHQFGEYVPNPADGTKTAECVCGKTDTIRDVKELKISGYNLALYNQVKIGFRVNADELFADNQYKNPTIKFKLGTSDEVVISEYQTINEGGVNYYVFFTDLIKMHRLGDEFSVKLCADDANTNEPKESEAKTSSVKDYCYAILRASTSPAELKTLAVDLLNLGAATQTYQGYNTTALVNADLDPATEAVLGTAAKPEISNGFEQSNERQELYSFIKSASITPEGKIKFRIYPDTYDYQLTDIYIRVALKSNPEKFVILDNADFTVDPGDTDLYFVEFEGLTAAQMREELEISIIDAEGNNIGRSEGYYYSIAAYVYDMRNNPDWNTNANLMDLLDCMIKYGDSAENYLDTVINAG